MIKHYNLKNISLTIILGLSKPTIIEILQKTVYKVFSNRFFHQNQTKKEKTLIRSLNKKVMNLREFATMKKVLLFME